MCVVLFEKQHVLLSSLVVLGVKTPDWNRRQQLSFGKCGWLSACLPVSLSLGRADRQAAGVWAGGSRSVSLLPLPSDETQSRWGGRNSAQASTKRKTLTSNHQQRRFRGGDFYLDVKQTSDKRRGGEKNFLNWPRLRVLTTRWIEFYEEALSYFSCPSAAAAAAAVRRRTGSRLCAPRMNSLDR